MPERIQPRTLKGFRDLLPSSMIPRERIISTAKAVYESYGFSPIETPALEYTEILLGKRTGNFYYVWILLLAAGTIIILGYFKTSMITFVKVATILSFLTAPFYAVANYLLVTGKHMPLEHRPQKGMRILSYLGIAFLLAFSFWYLIRMA